MTVMSPTINCGVLSEELCPGSSHTVTLECSTNGPLLRWCSTSPKFEVDFDASNKLNYIEENISGFSGKLTGISSEGYRYTSSLTFNSSLLLPGGTIVCKNISGSSTRNSSELSCPVQYLG